MKRVLSTFAIAVASIAAAAQDAPTRCVGSEAKPWDGVRRGQMVAEVVQARDYYFSPTNNLPLEEKKRLLNELIRTSFSKFVQERTAEYQQRRCTYRGIDWNKPGNSSWKTLTVQTGYQFDPTTLKRTTNGDWKAGPNWANNYTQLSWKTGGHRRSETFAEVDAVYMDIPGRVEGELDSVRKDLHAQSIPTYWP